jgi:hypothetical protein
MSSTSTPTPALKTRNIRSVHCTNPNCESGQRNRYFLGKHLSPYSFQVEQRYGLERRRLLNRAIHGWGVVYGFEIAKAPSGSLLIKPGLALDKCGRELLQVEELSLAVDDVPVIDKAGRHLDLASALRPAQSAPGTAPISLPAECWLLSAHYAEQDTEEVKAGDPCHCEHMEWNYTCETVRFSLQSMDCAECCKEPECELNCQCPPEGWCQQPDSAGRRGGRQCLCDYATRPSPGPACGSLEPCGSVRVDCHNGVPLACVKIVKDQCGEWSFGDVDACAPRRLVKRNDLLFDLIRGCDLTTIENYGWRHWHRRSLPPVPFSEFADAFAQASGYETKYVTRDFWVKFSRPVRRETVQQDCFVMTVISSEADDRWWETSRVPIVQVQMADADLIELATLVVDGPWLRGTVRSDSSRFQNKPFRVELEVRGDFIIDCNGQAIDANANGTPGGTFVSTFLVDAAPESVPDLKRQELIKGVS